MNVYDFTIKMYKCKGIILHAWKNDSEGNEVCEHRTFDGRFDHTLFDYKDYNVMMFEAPKKGFIEIWAENFDKIGEETS